MNWIKSTSENALGIATQKVKQKQFLWLISTVLCLAFGYHFYNQKIEYYLLGISIITFGLSFTITKIALPFLYIWMVIGNILSEISSTIILAIIYFLGFLPIKLFKFQKKTTNGWIKNDSETNFNEQF